MHLLHAFNICTRLKFTVIHVQTIKKNPATCTVVVNFHVGILIGLQFINFNNKQTATVLV